MTLVGPVGYMEMSLGPIEKPTLKITTYFTMGWERRAGCRCSDPTDASGCCPRPGVRCQVCSDAERERERERENHRLSVNLLVYTDHLRLLLSP